MGAKEKSSLLEILLKDNHNSSSLVLVSVFWRKKFKPQILTVYRTSYYKTIWAELAFVALLLVFTPFWVQEKTVLIICDKSISDLYRNFSVVFGLH